MRSRTNCSTISPTVRLRSTPFKPLAQKTQPMPQPTCVLMQAVRRPSSWISTHSISLRSRNSSSSLCVSSLARRCLATRLDSGTNDSANCCRSDLGRSVIASNESAPATSSQRCNCRARNGFSPRSSSQERSASSDTSRSPGSSLARPAACAIGNITVKASLIDGW